MRSCKSTNLSIRKPTRLISWTRASSSSMHDTVADFVALLLSLALMTIGSPIYLSYTKPTLIRVAGGSSYLTWLLLDVFCRSGRQHSHTKTTRPWKTSWVYPYWSAARVAVSKNTIDHTIRKLNLRLRKCGTDRSVFCAFYHLLFQPNLCLCHRSAPYL